MPVYMEVDNSYQEKYITYYAIQYLRTVTMMRLLSKHYATDHVTLIVDDNTVM